MILREKILYPKTVSDLKAALADCPDDMEIYDVMGETLCLVVHTFAGNQTIVFK